MLPKLILIALQLVIGYVAAKYVVPHIPIKGQAEIFVLAVVYAVIVWLVGMVGAIVLKDVVTPSSATLTAAVVGALVFAAITLVPAVTQAVASVVKGLDKNIYPLIGAVLGYAIKK